MAGLKEKFRTWRGFELVKDWLATHSLPGFYGIPVLEILAFVRQELRKESLIVRANAMAFSFFLAIFPSIIVVFSLMGFIPVQGLIQTLKHSLMQVMPSEAAIYLTGAIEEITSIPRGGLLSLSLLLTGFFASNGMLSMLRGFEKRYEITYKTRSNLRRRLVALQLTGVLGLLLITSLVVIVLGRVLAGLILSWAQIDYDAVVLLLYLRWLVIVVVFYSGISLIYRYGPALRKRMPFFTPGATLATILSILSSLLFSYYVNQFGTYNQFYGSLGALIVLMLWLQINSFIILIGYELNASIIVTKALRELNKDK